MSSLYHQPFQAPLTPASFLERTVVAFPDRVAVVEGSTRYTYRTLYERVHRLARGLYRLGVQRGDRVAAVVPNTKLALELHLAVPLMGAVLVPINVRLKSKEMSYILNHSEAVVLFVDDAYAERLVSCLEEVPSVRVLIVDGTDKHFSTTRHIEKPVDVLPYESWLQSVPFDPMSVSVQDEWDLISIHYTSGTTGRPKGVMLHHRGAFINAFSEIIEMNLSPDSVYLWTLPMFHAAGWCFPWAVTAVGATHVLLRKVEASRIVQLIESEGITHFCAAPPVLTMISQYLGSERTGFPGTVHIITAAAPPSPALLRKLESFGAKVTHVYGLTEVYGPFTINEWRKEWDALPDNQRAELKARQGIPYIGLGELTVVDDKMRQVPKDGLTMGEVLMRGNGVMLGYYKDEEATAQAFHGGWFHTGDLAVWHADGYIELKDRQKDIIISGGENISSVEVERVLLEHPSVLEAAVIGIPDRKWGEVPKAFITVQPGESVSVKELQTFCRKRLAHFKCPKEIEFCELPRTNTGKVQKHLLREKEREKQLNTN